MSGARVGKSTPVNERFNETSTHDNIHATAAPGGAVVVHMDGKSGGDLIGRVLSQLRWSSFWSALAALGLVLAYVGYSESSRDARVVEDEVLRLRVAVQAAGIQVPDPEEN